MKHQLNRKEKIQLLKAIMDGRASIDTLKPPQFYVFITSDKEPNNFKMGGKSYSMDEYLAFCEGVNKRNDGSLIWDEIRTYGPDKVYTIKIVRNQKPSLGYNK